MYATYMITIKIHGGAKTHEKNDICDYSFL